jgi:hypothetical protein
VSLPVLLHGTLASHRRGRVLEEALGAAPGAELPGGGAALLAFAEEFQTAAEGERKRLVEWTRTPGHLLLLVPPFASPGCDDPVSWRAERMEAAPRGGTGLAKVLAPEVTHRITGKLQAPTEPGAIWSDLSTSLGTHRAHPAAGLFAVTCLPLWSLTVLDAAGELESWFASLFALAGRVGVASPPAESPLSPDHYGLLVFLLARSSVDEEEALAALARSSVFRFPSDRARSLLVDLRARGLVEGAAPTTEAAELVERSPYAHFVHALRQVATP